MNPYDKAHELARALRESHEYQTLLDRKRTVDADPAAKKMLDDFRRHQWELETRRIMGEGVTDDELQQINQMQEAIHMHALLREYVEAEYRFGVIYSDVHKILGDAVREVIGNTGDFAS